MTYRRVVRLTYLAASLSQGCTYHVSIYDLSKTTSTPVNECEQDAQSTHQTSSTKIRKEVQRELRLSLTREHLLGRIRIQHEHGIHRWGQTDREGAAQGEVVEVVAWMRRNISF